MSGEDPNRFAAPEIGSASPAIWKNATFFILTSGVLVLCGLMLYPFFPAITGAIVLAVITRRPQQWWFRKIGHRTAAASSALLVVTIGIIAPVLLLFQNLAQNLLAGAKMLQDGRIQRSLDAFLQHYPQITATFEYSSEFISFSEATKKVAAFLASHLAGLLSNSVAALAQIVIMLFLLFFLYRDEVIVLKFLHRLLPLSEVEASDLVCRLGETIRATVLGRLVVAVAQGTLAGVVLGLLGVRAALILGVLTAVVSLVPSFGAYIIWLPVVAYFVISGHWIKAIILIAIGSLLISTIDNFLYPVLIGSRLRQHTAAVFFSLLGGIWLFGISGLVLGPLLFSAAESVLNIWKARLHSAELPQGPD